MFGKDNSLLSIPPLEWWYAQKWLRRITIQFIMKWDTPTTNFFIGTCLICFGKQPILHFTKLLETHSHARQWVPFICRKLDCWRKRKAQWKIKASHTVFFIRVAQIELSCVILNLSYLISYDSVCVCLFAVGSSTMRTEGSSYFAEVGNWPIFMAENGNIA